MGTDSNDDPRRILVFRIGHLGDTIVALPAFRAVREAFPRSHIAFLCNAAEGNESKVPATAVIPERGIFDELIGYRTPSGPGKVSGAFRLIRRLRKAKFDAVFYLMPRIRTRAQVARDLRFFSICGIRRSFGDGFLANNLLELPSKAPLGTVVYEGDFLLNCLKGEGLGIEMPSRALPDLEFSDEQKNAAYRWLEAKTGSRPGSRPLVGIGPGSKWDSKVWPEDRFRSVIRDLIREKDAFPLVFGGPEDMEKGKRLVNAWGRGAVAAGSLNVREAGAALSYCGLYLGNDTGTMHLAAAAGATCVAVFAAIDYPGRWEPPGDRHRFFRTRVPCEGCHTPDCFNEHLCLTSVSAEEVLEACANVIDGK